MRPVVCRPSWPLGAQTKVFISELLRDIITEKYHHADSFVEGIAYDRKARGVKVVEVLFGIKVPRRSPWLQKFTEEADLPPTGNSKRLRLSV